MLNFLSHPYTADVKKDKFERGRHQMKKEPADKERYNNKSPKNSTHPKEKPFVVFL